jgi:uncharacterized membrane protein
MLAALIRRPEARNSEGTSWRILRRVHAAERTRAAQFRARENTAMADTVERSTRPIPVSLHPTYSLLLPVSIVCFTGALVTDIAYLSSDGDPMWLDISSWLIAVGLVFGGIAGLVLLVEVARDADLRHRRGWLEFGLLLAAWIVEFVNALIHARDGWTAVMPAGLILSIVGVLLVLLTGWLWRYRIEGEAK